MQFKLGIVMDPIESIKTYKDSSFAMLLAAQKRGWPLYYMQQSDIYMVGATAMAHAQRLEVTDNPENWYSTQAIEDIELASLNAILMRKDPPFDIEYITSTYILEMAEREGSLIVNKPASLRDANEKMFITHFPQCCTPMMVTSNSSLVRQFISEQKDVIVKPLDGMGGESIFRLTPNDPNISVILETITQHGQKTIMAQRFIPEITAGDKRILLINGEPVPYALARIPAQGETRGNIAAGGSGVGIELTERDHWICDQVGPSLREKGIFFAGIDVIGDYLTEINITSPTCIRELDKQFNLDIAGQLMDCIEQQAKH
ncbi:MAG: glutathione synthase [Gammaproteobacteria bacterium]|nr:glutathione synthase [Gammaproteobacteria bacterium]MCK5263582.1 glutathione synthase [Gammaproteobacteria bacterium]